jgi:TolA-binding protein
MKKNRSINHLLTASLIFAISVLALGCSNEDEELKKQINREISVVEKQVEALETHQQNMRKMIGQMETQLQAMRAELQKEAPRIEAARQGTQALRDLNMHGFGESPAESTLKNPAWNVLWVLFFLLLLWLFYRFRVKATSKSE